jgi:hypothetical protein
MRLFRTGLLLGLAIGYVLGTKAGRERYEQISRVAKRAWESEPAGRLRMEVSEKMPAAMTGVVHKIGEIRHRNGDREMMTGAGRLPA